MFKKQIILVLAFGLLCTLLIGYSIINVSSSSDSFSGSGYVHVTSNESSTKKILFDSGTTYKKKVDGKISFSDSLGDDSNVDEINFIHYDDSSLSSFVDGVLVDLNDLSSGSAMNHYAIPANTILTKNNSSYSVLNSSDNLSFKDFIWKVDEGKYLCVSPSMRLRIADSDERTINGYVEISYIGDGKRVIQIQTDENIWQTISDDCHLVIDNGLDINLSNRDIESSEDTVLLDFSRIVINSEDNVELSPISLLQGESVIPHFDITAENGADGMGGTAGTNGAAGESAMDGDPGADALPGEDGDEGEASTVYGDILDFPVFTVYDWEVSSTGCKGKIKVTEKHSDTEPSMLQADEDDKPDEKTDVFSKIFVQDLSTGKKFPAATIDNQPHDAPRNADGTYEPQNKEYDRAFINIAFNNYSEGAVDPGKFIEFTFENLEPDHSYVLQISSPTNIDPSDINSKSYSRPYVSKTFWTDSFGFFVEAEPSTEDTITFKITRQSYASPDFKVFYEIFDSYNSSSDGTTIGAVEAQINDDWQVIDFGNDASGLPNNIALESIPGLPTNCHKYIRIAYGYDDVDADKPDIISDQIIEIATLKAKGSVGSPLLSTNRNIWGFDITPGNLIDEDNSFVSYTYEFYRTEDVADDDMSVTNPAKLSIPTTDLGTYSVVADGTHLVDGQSYRVRTVATFFDNEKEYTVCSPFSNSAIVESSSRPVVYFEAQSGRIIGGGTTDESGTYVEVDQYDSIIGKIHINPGVSGADLLIPGGLATGNYPKVTIKLDGYYTVTYTVYDKNFDPGLITDLNYLLAERTGTEIVIDIKDAISSVAEIKGAVNGLMPGQLYEVLVTGDIATAEKVIESNTTIGRCVVKTADTVPMTALWSPISIEDPDIFKGVSLRIIDSASIKYNGNNKIEHDNDGYVQLSEGSSNTAKFDRQRLTTRQIELYVFGTTLNEDKLAEAVANCDAGKRSGEVGYFLKKATIEVGPNKNPAIYSALFSTSGYKVTRSTFNLTDAEFDELSTLPGITLYAKPAVYDYTHYEEYRKNQEPYSSLNNVNKNLVYAPTNKFYYENLIDMDNLFMFLEGKDGDGNNKYKESKACYITPSKGMQAINITQFDYLNHSETTVDKYSYDNYEMNAYFPNITNAARRITYYVYDAVDFYNASNLGTISDSDNVTIKYANSTQKDYTNVTEYQYNGKTYNQNKDFVNYITDIDNAVNALSDTLAGETVAVGLEPSLATKYVTPVNMDGLELAKITIPIPADSTAIPGARFIALGAAEYADLYGFEQVDKEKIYDDNYFIDENGRYAFFFNHTSNSADAAPNTNSPRGHEFVFAWTIDCVTEQDGTQGSKEVRYIYPFDSYIFDENDDDSQIKFDEIASDSGMYTELIQNYGTMDNSTYVIDNPNAVFGKQAYMLIPHSTFTEFTPANAPKIDPIVYSIIWDSSKDTITTRSYVYDRDDAIFSTDRRAYVINGGDTIATNEGHPTNSSNALLSRDEIYEKLLKATLTEDDNNAGFNEITVQTSSLGTSSASNNDKDVITLLKVQKYVDKYLDGQDYITQSNDGNWKMEISVTDSNGLSSIINADDLNRYSQMFAEPINNSAYSSYQPDYSSLGANVEATIVWRKPDDIAENTDTFFVIVKGKPEYLRNAVGYRITLTDPGDNRSYYIDKFIQTRDSYSNENGANVALISESGSDAFVRFKVSLPNELAKTTSEIKYKSDGQTQTYNYFDITPSNGNSKDINLDINILYDTGKLGYKDVAVSYTDSILASSSHSNVYSDDTYALRVYDDIGALTYTIEGKQYKGVNNFNYYQFSGDTTIQNASLYNFDYPKAGSFFNLRLNSEYLTFKSTRSWQYQGNRFVANTFDNDNKYGAVMSVFGANNTSANAGKVLVPSKLGLSSTISPKVYNTDTIGSNMYPSYAQAIGSGQTPDNVLKIPPVPPLVFYPDYESGVNSAKQNIGYTNADDHFFYTLSKQKPDTNYQADYYPLEFYSDYASLPENDKLYGDCANVVRVKIDPGTSLPMAPSSMRISNYPPKADKSIPDNLLDYMIQVDTTGKTQDELAIFNLSISTEYYITCWRVAGSGQDMKFVPVDMADPDHDDLTIDNYTMIATIALPTNAFVTNYKGLTDSNKTLTISNIDSFDLEKRNSSSVDVQESVFDYYDESGNTDYYTVFDLYKGCDQDEGFYYGGDWLTYLYVGQDIKSDITFDLDGVWKAASNEYVYKYSTRDALTNDANGPLLKDGAYVKDGDDNKLSFDDLYYNGAYYVKMHVYEINKGPAYVAGYDFATDPDSIFVDPVNQIDSTPCRRFAISRAIDTASVSASNELLKESSTMYFTVSGLSYNSGSLLGNENQVPAFVPVLIWTTKNESGQTEMYDVTSFLDKKGSQTYSNSLKLNLAKLVETEEVDEDGHKKKELEPIFDVGSKLELFIYSFQNAQYSVVDKVINNNSKILAYNADGKHLGTQLSPGLVLNSSRQFAYNAGATENVKQYPINAAQYSKLKEESVNYNGGTSRLVTQVEKIVPASRTSAGDVSITLSGNAVLASLSGATTKQNIKGVRYDITTFTKYKDGDIESQETYPSSIYTQDLQSQIASSVSDNFTLTILSDITAKFADAKKASGKSHNNETPIGYQITIQFYDVDNNEPVVIDSSTGDKAGYVLSADCKTLTVTIKIDPDSSLPAGNYSQLFGNSNNFFSSNPIVSLLNKLFNTSKDGGNNE